MKKVVFLCSKHPPFDKRVFYKEGISIKEHGFEVEIICPNAIDGIYEGIKIKSFKQKQGLKNRLLSLKDLYRAAIEEYIDVIIAPEPDSLFIAFLLQVKYPKTKVIFDSHEYYYRYFDYINSKLLRFLLNKFIDRALNYLVKRISGVIVVTKLLHEKYSSLNQNTVLIINTTNTVPTLLNNGKEYFIYQGLLYHPDIIIELGRTMKRRRSNFKLLILGGFGKEYELKKKEFIKRIQEEGIENQIILKNWVEREEVNIYLGKSIAGIILFSLENYNSRNSLPNKLFDYMAIGLPVISMNYPEITRIVEEEKCGIIIYNGELESFVEAMETISNNTNLRKELGINSYDAIKEKYNWDNYKRKLIDMVENL